MRGSRTAVGLLLLLPAVAAAGPIQVRLAGVITSLPSDGGYYGYPGGNFAERAVFASTPAGPVTVDPAAPLALSLLRVAPPDLRSDHQGNPYGGNATYYAADSFTLAVKLTDVASGQSGEVTFGGRLHADYTSAGNDVWRASAYVWLQTGTSEVTLGGNRYTLATPSEPLVGPRFAGGDFTLWVGDHAPVNTPEPGTLALAAIGLAPLGWRLRRRNRFPS